MAEFDPAFKFMMSHEDATRSGRVTKDGDGRTRFGICERFHPRIRADFWTMPANDAMAVAEEIYQGDYWSKLQLAEIVDQAVASKLFDMCVPMGLRKATVLAQRAANGLLLGSSRAPAIDGVMGPKTIQAINACPPSAMVESLCNLSKIHFCDVATAHPDKEVDLRGWLVRASAVPAHAIGASA